MKKNIILFFLITLLVITIRIVPANYQVKNPEQIVFDFMDIIKNMISIKPLK